MSRYRLRIRNVRPDLRESMCHRLRGWHLRGWKERRRLLHLFVRVDRCSVQRLQHRRGMAEQRRGRLPVPSRLLRRELQRVPSVRQRDVQLRVGRERHLCVQRRMGDRQQRALHSMCARVLRRQLHRVSVVQRPRNVQRGAHWERDLCLQQRIQCHHELRVLSSRFLQPERCVQRLRHVLHDLCKRRPHRLHQLLQRVQSYDEWDVCLLR